MQVSAAQPASPLTDLPMPLPSPRLSISLLLAGALQLATTPAAAATATLTVRASGSLAANVGPIMKVRVNGTAIGKVEVRATAPTDYAFTATALVAGAKVDVVFTNDAVINGQDRNLYVAYLQDGTCTVLPTAPGNTYDRGIGAKAFDGLDVVAAQGNLYSNGALRFTWPSAAAAAAPTAAQQEAARLLQQGSFGPTTAEINRVVSIGQPAWLAEQLAMPYSPSYLPAMQRLFDLGDDYRPGGSKYAPSQVARQFWKTAATSPDQLRKRTAFALHQVFMVSQADSNIWGQARAYAQYHDTLNQQAFGNYRNLLEDMALRA